MGVPARVLAVLLVAAALSACAPDPKLAHTTGGATVHLADGTSVHCALVQEQDTGNFACLDENYVTTAIFPKESVVSVVADPSPSP